MTIGQNSPAFLGREHFDEKTLMWTFRDGTGAIPDEMRQELFEACEDRNALGGNGIPVLCTLFEWKRRLTPNL